ncbi:MAG: hypothetical protein VB138_02780 [Burkholderia sp.]
MNTAAGSLIRLASRVGAIQPFYVMEVVKRRFQKGPAGLLTFAASG